MCLVTPCTLSAAVEIAAERPAEVPVKILFRATAFSVAYK